MKVVDIVSVWDGSRCQGHKAIWLWRVDRIDHGELNKRWTAGFGGASRVLFNGIQML